GKRADAIKKMVSDVKAGQAYPGQLVIYPQGTRVPPDEKRPYKVGTAALQQALGQPCVPVAVNVGLLWPKRGIMRKPGTAVVEFLPRIEPGLSVADFMEKIETDIETKSDALMDEYRACRG
ncbi:MAG: 1-acyl-sn-glycerol-3-phosphate acyltransferase, partial [Pseudomonadota bacterium]